MSKAADLCASLDADASSADRALIDLLVAQKPGYTPTEVVAREFIVVRILIALAAPFWVGATLVASAVRAVRGRRPVFVLCARVGHQRVPLHVPKIATAQVSGNDRRWGGLVEVASGPPIEIGDEPGFESWLRSSGLDELPQLALVVAGKMRLVGPRPVTVDELRKMAHANEQGEVGVDRLQPGLIGLWQVLDRHHYELSDRCRLDLAMVDNWSRRWQWRLIRIAARQTIKRLRPN